MAPCHSQANQFMSSLFPLANTCRLSSSCHLHHGVNLSMEWDGWLETLPTTQHQVGLFSIVAGLRMGGPPRLALRGLKRTIS
eukprot:3878437-Amphidinium_carterae.1